MALNICSRSRVGEVLVERPIFWVRRSRPRPGQPHSCEPPVPSGDVDEEDEEMMKHVDGFNDWIKLISNTQQTHYVAFTPLFDGTIVAFLKM